MREDVSGRAVLQMKKLSCGETPISKLKITIRIFFKIPVLFPLSWIGNLTIRIQFHKFRLNKQA